jgi:hypothetical protein
MKYLMFVANDPDGEVDETGEGTLDIGTWVDSNEVAGKWVMGDRLRPVEDSTTVRLLARACLTAEAVRALDQAVPLARTDQERRQLMRRRDELASEIGRS